MTASPPQVKRPPLDVHITHEPYIPWLILQWDGQSEELEHAEAITWFSAHGAKDLKAVNDAICYALNFGASVFTIKEPVEPVQQLSPDTPRI